ncbi:hypothetical protein H2248_012651 [Termitomyces sp. 'cryptogamus']|nr:hypothetical protein H2248_012651 [Termitomyces sp. 'cryptogamus']
MPKRFLRSPPPSSRSFSFFKKSISFSCVLASFKNSLTCATSLLVSSILDFRGPDAYKTTLVGMEDESEGVADILIVLAKVRRFGADERDVR